MKLLVVRHAIAMDREDYATLAQAPIPGASSSRPSDDFRPLTLEGMRKMKKNAKGLRKLVKEPAMLVSSPLTRAMQTAEILQTAWRGLEITTCDLLRPGSSMSELAAWLREHAEKGSSLITIVGHEPHLSSLVSWFLTGAEKSLLDLKKGGAALLEFPSRIERGKARLLWLATPGFLRGL